MGANTYIGNAPNLMVKAIAEDRGVKMPSFFGYMLWSGGILVPLFIVMTFIWFGSDHPERLPLPLSRTARCAEETPPASWSAASFIGRSFPDIVLVARRLREHFDVEANPTT